MKHKDIIDKMTLEEKASILSGKSEWESRGIPRLNIPSIFCRTDRMESESRKE